MSAARWTAFRPQIDATVRKPDVQEFESSPYVGREFRNHETGLDPTQTQFVTRSHRSPVHPVGGAAWWELVTSRPRIVAPAFNHTSPSKRLS